MTAVTREEITNVVCAVLPLDSKEKAHLEDVRQWIASGEPLFRTQKPDVPPKHLVSYFVLFDCEARKILLVDHKKAELWLPPGGHVEPGEHPREAARREAREELGIEADFFSPSPLFVTVTQTVGKTAGHTDVSLWYLLRAREEDKLDPDPTEFRQVRWFGLGELPLERSDPHMGRFVDKLLNLTKKEGQDVSRNVDSSARG